MITEPDVTFTDYGLAAECVLFTYLLGRRGNRQQLLRTWFAVFFGSLGVASLFGGTVHGFFLDAETAGHQTLWPATLLAIGVTTLAAWIVGAQIQFSRGVARAISIAAVLQLVGYSVVVMFIVQTFRVAILNYLPASIFLLVVFFLTYVRVRKGPVLIGLVGIVLTFVAAGVQQAGIVVHPIYFNHNALYHVIQAVALFMIFWSARWFTVATERLGSRTC